MTLPFVTALMPTCNRFPHEGHLAGEAVESFLRQTYPNKQLLILNDTPGQTLVFDHPQVKIVNLDKRIATLTEKWFFGASLAETDIICPWDDDDIYLPHRIEQSVKQLVDIEFWMPPSLWFWYENRQEKEQRAVSESLISFDTGIVRRDAFLNATTTANLEPIALEPIASDWTLANEMLRFPNVRIKFNEQRQHPPNLDRFYIYRRGVSDQHLSGSNLSDRDRYAEVANNVVPGTYTIKPSWSRDWTRICERAVVTA